MRLLVALSFLLLLLTSPARAAGGYWELRVPGAVSIEALPPNVSLSPLLKVTSDRDAKVYGLNLMRNASGAPVGLYMAESTRARAATGTPYLFADIASRDGVTLFETDGHKVLLLQGALNAKGTQGRFHLRYLSNGLFGTYDTCDVLLQSQNGAYYMQNAYTGARVAAVKVITSALGVDTLQGICPAR